MLDIDKPSPLSRWVVGTFTFHFSEGAVVTRRMCLDEAHQTEAIIADRRSSDALSWHSLAWLQFDSTSVVFASFKVAEDAGWGMSADERAALAKVGHPHGILRSLVDYWAAVPDGEPEYSLTAIYGLHQAALKGLGRQKWERYARLAEGEGGAERLLRATAPTRPEADDHAEPESAPATEATGTQDETDPENTAGTDPQTGRVAPPLDASPTDHGA